MVRIIKPVTIITRFILALLGCSVLLLIAGTAFWFYYDYNRELRLLNQRVEEIRQSIVPAMVNSIWLTDWELVRVQTEGIMRMPAIRRVELVVDGRNIVALGGDVSDGASSLHTVPLVQRYKEREVSLGTLSLYTDEKAVRQQLLRRLGGELVLRLVTILIITSILFLLFHRMVGRHLTTIASQLRALSQEPMETPLVLDKKPHAHGAMDEIDQVVFSFNEMQQRLFQSFAELQRANEELRKENSERVKGEEALRESRSMLRDILDTVPQAIFWKDLHGGYLGCNRVFAEAVGVGDPEKIVGRTDFDLPWPREEAEAYRADDAAVITSRQSKWHIIEPLQRADGTRLWIDTTKVPMLDGEENVRGVLGVYDDITERIRNEEEKTRLEARLNQAQKMEAIGVLAGGIAHDFNNILAAIIGYGEMAAEDATPDSQLAKDLEKVLLSAHRAKDLVRQILAFSRQSSAERGPVQIQPLVKEALKMLRASIPSSITISEDIDPRCGAILADPTQVLQIIMNLCTNAFHAMETTGGVLSLRVKLKAMEDGLVSLGKRPLPPGEYLELTVSDTGTGIAPEILDKIFDPYFTTKGVGKGTGMGLSISHGIVTSCGGAINVKSIVGQGTTFDVYFPVIQQQADEVGQPVEAPAGKGRILFVDDEKLLMEMGRDLLERLGYTVTAHQSSIEALEAFINDPERFDLVITDQTMPGLAGIELARRMLQIRPELPIILCTGFSNLVNEESAKAMGIREFALKPLTKSSIAHLIHKHLADKRVG